MTISHSHVLLHDSRPGRAARLVRIANLGRNSGYIFRLLWPKEHLYLRDCKVILVASVIRVGSVITSTPT